MRGTPGWPSRRASPSGEPRFEEPVSGLAGACVPCNSVPPGPSEPLPQASSFLPRTGLPSISSLLLHLVPPGSRPVTGTKVRATAFAHRPSANAPACSAVGGKLQTQSVAIKGVPRASMHQQQQRQQQGNSLSLPFGSLRQRQRCSSARRRRRWEHKWTSAAEKLYSLEIGALVTRFCEQIACCIHSGPQLPGSALREGEHRQIDLEALRDSIMVEVTVKRGGKSRILHGACAVLRPA